MLAELIKQKSGSMDETSPRQVPYVIAIDGPAASGKGTLARRIAAHCKLNYLDTGSLYRAVAFKLLKNNADLSDIALAVKACQQIQASDLDNPELRSEEVGQAASTVSAIREVRQALLDFQRQFAKAGRGAVLDGRDIGTVICPDANIKLFITADIATRAKRRHEELLSWGKEVSFEDIYKELEIRDARDRARTTAPLIAAADAIHIDTTNISAEEAFGKAVKVIESKLFGL